ncbi:putative glycosidase crf1 [Golovinomyces cichoracearum]|uniref:Crh-like protein n=1 Tax=Golovinomyces cichoracearum TaxID=62708 RepID=A0A420IQF7_9PEZI|nr:putative glycosidase crf1 [Golovinomyces cichoracearum]
MRPISLSLGAFLYMTVSQVKAQTFTDCNPLEKSCPPKPGLGTSVFADFTTGESDYWKPLEPTKVVYDPAEGMKLSIKTPTDSSTMALTKYIMFGHIDMVAKASHGNGIVSSFVLLSQDLDEIDWEWIGGDNNNVQTNFFGKGDTSSYDRATHVPIKAPIETFHTYSLDWTAERIVWLIDGTAVRTVTYTDPITKGGKIYPQSPMQVKVGNWIGCLDASNIQTQGTCQWAGGQADLSKGPFIMSVKSLNVTDYGCGGEYSYSDRSGNWQSIKSTGKCDGKGTGPGIKSNAEPKSPPEIGPVLAPPVKSTPASNSTAPLPGKETGTASKTGYEKPGSLNADSAKTNVSEAVLSTSDASGKSNHTFGKTEAIVCIIGLCLGYLVM